MVQYVCECVHGGLGFSSMSYLVLHSWMLKQKTGTGPQLSGPCHTIQFQTSLKALRSWKWHLSETWFERHRSKWDVGDGMTGRSKAQCKVFYRRVQRPMITAGSHLRYCKGIRGEAGFIIVISGQCAQV